MISEPDQVLIMHIEAEKGMLNWISHWTEICFFGRVKG